MANWRTCLVSGGLAMHAILEHCSGARETSFPVGSQIIREGETSGRLYVLVAGQLEIVKGGMVVANVGRARIHR